MNRIHSAQTYAVPSLKRMEKRVYLSSPTMHSMEMRFIQEAFDRNWIAPTGFNIDAFEEEIAQYLAGGQWPIYTLALSSGTAALHLAVKLAGVKPGDTVFCSDMTFVATVNPVAYEGGVQVFIDSEPETWNMDPRALELAFQKYPHTKVVILAHLYGTPSKMDEIMDVCDRYHAVLIEDAAESLSAIYKGRETGTFGRYNVLSFNGNKIITTSAGGMLVSSDPTAISKASHLATQARERAPWYQHEEIGYNYRLSNVLAGIGRGQMFHIENHRLLKERIYRRYEKGLQGLPVRMNPYEKGIAVPNFWLSCLLIDKDADVTPMDIYYKLEKLNIESRPIWKPMHMQPVFDGYDFISYLGDVGADVFSRGLCLPSDIKMTPKDQEAVIQAIWEVF